MQQLTAHPAELDISAVLAPPLRLSVATSLAFEQRGFFFLLLLSEAPFHNQPTQDHVLHRSEASFLTERTFLSSYFTIEASILTHTTLTACRVTALCQQRSP